MNLLDTASLVVTPNGYKASKLYSIVPSDGTGDMTFARTGDTATRVNSSGLIETVLANKPRLDYLGSTCPKLLLEPQRTNLAAYSDQFDNAYWTKLSGTITANNTTSPDGTSNADLYNCVNSTYNLVRRGLPTTNGTTYTASIFVKKNNYRYIGFRCIYAGDTFNFYDFDTNTVNNAIAPSYPIIATNYGNGWVRLSITGTANDTFAYFDFGYVNASGNCAGIAAGTEKYYIYGAQLEAGAYATTYIPTTTASVTRNVDDCSKTSATALIGQTEGVMFWDGIISNVGSNVIFNLNLNATNDRYIEITSGLAIRYIDYSTTTQASISTAGNYVTLGNRYKIAAAYKANDFVLYVNGVQIGTDTSGTVFAADKVYNGYYASGFQGLIKNNSIALWKTRLTNQELVTLTTI